jgi:hypothetical protein
MVSPLERVRDESWHEFKKIGDIAFRFSGNQENLSKGMLKERLPWRHRAH